jgi:hypothetical protein
LGEATADGELALCPAKPGFEVGAVGFEGEHGSEPCRMPKRGQDEDRRFADLRALGYLVGMLLMGLEFPSACSFSAAIWSRRWAARSNSRRADAARICSSRSAMVRCLS